MDGAVIVKVVIMALILVLVIVTICTCNKFMVLKRGRRIRRRRLISSLPGVQI